MYRAEQHSVGREVAIKVVKPFARPRAPAPFPHARAQLALSGQDRPGIVRDVSRVIAERGANVEELESEVQSAPMSGEQLFRARYVLSVPATFDLAELRLHLEALAGELMVDVA